MLVKRAFQIPPRPGLLVASGTLLVAATYGMARFGVGVLHPAMALERPDLSGALPAAGSAQFVSYCVAAALAAVVPHRSRALAALAGLVAGAGCVGLAVSGSAAAFVTSAFVAGAGAGLASPALVGLLDEGVPPGLAGTAQAVVNAGTAVGVVGAGLVAGAVTSPASAWLLMAALCLAPAAGVVVLGRDGTDSGVAPDERRTGAATLLGPVAGAFLAGAASAAVWTYGPTVMVTAGAFAAGQVGWLWAAVGVGGLAGALVDRPVRRLGPVRTFAGCVVVLLVGTVLVVGPTAGSTAGAVVGAAAFGAAYMGLSGVLILWSRRLDPARAAAVTAWLFVALAVGQAVGAQLLAPALT